MQCEDPYRLSLKRSFVSPEKTENQYYGVRQYSQRIWISRMPTIFGNIENNYMTERQKYAFQKLFLLISTIKKYIT